MVKGFPSTITPLCLARRIENRLPTQVAREKRYVVRTEASQKCECYERRGILEPRGFERFPNELTRPLINVSQDDRDELASLAETVRNGKLCSFFLRHFLKCCQQETGFVPGEAVKEVSRRVSKIDRMGLHCSASIVSRLLIEIAVQHRTEDLG